MKKYWLAITGDKRRLDSPKETWWCLPKKAEFGDSVICYLPRSANHSKNGIFAEYKIVLAPTSLHEKNFYCSGYGQGQRQHSSLGYTELVLAQKFDVFLTAREMKADLVLSKAGFVGRNFQGTTFEIKQEYYQIIIHLISEKMKK